MATDDQWSAAAGGRAVDGQGFDKLLALLEGLKKSPAGAALYQQIERLVGETEQTYNRITRAYASLALVLIETYRAQLPRDTRLYLDLQIVQQRLKPPVSLAELASLRRYLRQVAGILSRVGRVDQDALRIAIAPLLDEPAASAAPHAAPPVDRSAGPATVPGKRIARDNQVASMYRRRLQRQHLEMDKIQKALIEKVDHASDQQQRVVNSLTALLQKLGERPDSADPGQFRALLVDDVNELVSAQGILTTVLNESRSLLSRVDDNNEALRHELSQVQVLSLTDDLTQLPNRRAFRRRLEDEIERSQRGASSLTLAMLDLDHFKLINDRHGHNVGDEILRTYTREILSVFRRYDMVSRYGGEEFAILLPSTDREGALRAFAKVREKAAGCACVYNGVRIRVPTFSAGLAVYGGEPLQTFIDRADRALYKAKQGGRDRVVVAGEAASGSEHDDQRRTPERH